VVDEQDNLVAIGLAFPDIAPFMKEKGGRFSLPIILKILKQVRKPKNVEFAIIAVKPGYDRKGAAALLMRKIYRQMVKDGIWQVESNPELETNLKIQSLWSSFKREQHKKRATFFKNIGAQVTSVKSEKLKAVETLLKQ
jgi:hypothetical protein